MDFIKWYAEMDERIKRLEEETARIISRKRDVKAEEKGVVRKKPSLRVIQGGKG